MSGSCFRIMGMALAAVVFSSVATARADEFRSQIIDGYWTEYNSWERLDESHDPRVWVDLEPSDAVPGCGDTATIRYGDSLEVRSYESVGISYLTVETGGCPPGPYPCFGLRIYGTVELCGASATLSLKYERAVHLYDDGILRVTTGATITDDTAGGDGSLRGHTPGCTIQIGPASGSGTITLSNSAEIRGILRIQRNDNNQSGVGIFHNSGLVNADAAGDLELSATLSGVTDTAGSCSSPRWRVWGNYDVPHLRFNEPATGLHGDFEVGGGSSGGSGDLRINADVTTDGHLKFISVGAIVVAANKTFNVTGTGGVGSGNHYCSGSDCSSESFPYNGPTTVSCP